MIRTAVLALVLAGAAEADVGYLETVIEVDHRDVLVPLHLWYPAEPGTPEEVVGGNPLFEGHPAHPGAEPLGETAPVVLLSHGSGGNAPNLGWLATALAERGMIVAAPNHPGTTSADSLPSRTVMPWERAWDMIAILDRLRRDPPEGLMPDTGRVATLGFSLGAHTALRVVGAQLSKDAFIDYCDGNDELDCGWLRRGGVNFEDIEALLYEGQDRDPRVDAAVAVDPALTQATTPEGLRVIELPVLIVSLGADGTIPLAVEADDVAGALPDARHRFVEGAVHLSFLGLCRDLPAEVIAEMTEGEPVCDDADRPREEIYEELRGVIGDFLEEALAEDG